MGTLAEGIKEIFATAKTTGSNVMLCGNDGTPDGHMTMANLASVLGVFKNGGIISNIDTLFDEGYYSSWSDSFGFYIVFVYKSSDGKALQFYISTQETKYRYSTDNSTWQSWNVLSYPIELRNYTTLSSLTNAIGGLMFIGNREDANVIGTYFSTTGSMNNQHFPTGGSYWTLISIGDNIIKLCFQIAFAPNGDSYFRSYWNGWKSWREL